MKKFFLSSIAALISAVYVSAQDMAQATEKAMSANEALKAGDTATALASFKEALKMAKECGEEGQELVATCQNAIPTIMLQDASKFIEAKQYAEAIPALEEVVKVAGEYGAQTVADEATALIPDALMALGGAQFNAKDFENAAATFAKVVAAQPTNGKAALRQGMALANIGKKAEAEAAFAVAVANGEAETANQQLSVMYVKEAAAALKAKDFAAAAAASDKSNSFRENANAYKIAGNAYSQLKKTADAIKNFKKYLELSPSAKDAAQINYTVAALSQQAGDKATALEYYKKVTADPKFGETAKAQIAALSK